MNIEALTKAEQRKYFLAKRNSISDEDIETFKKVSLKVSQNIKEKLK